MSESIKRCAACRKENRVSEMKLCMHNQMHRYVCDSTCMNDFYNPPKKPAAPEPVPSAWRCFQCDEVFEDEASAALHFGDHQRHRPACTIDVAEYRAMEARMYSYNEEDAEIHRAMARMHNQHRVELQREEEKGYARGLRDAALAEPVQGEEVDPFAWAEFDGEGGHDLRLYENNEDFHQEYVKRNGDKYASWVFPLYTAAARPDAELVALMESIATHMRHAIFAPFGVPATPFDRDSVALCARIDAKLAELRK